MLPFFILALPLMRSALLLHYPFWSEPSQAIFDYSGNHNDGVNGSTAASDSFDATVTAVGFYFGAIGQVTVGRITLPSSGFSIEAWVRPLGNSVLFTYNPSSQQFVWKLWGSPGLVMKTTSKSGTSMTSLSGTVEISSGKWDLFTVKVACAPSCLVTGYAHNEVVIGGLTGSSSGKAGINATIGPGDFYMYDFKIFSEPVTVSDIANQYAPQGIGGCPINCPSNCILQPAVTCLGISACHSTCATCSGPSSTQCLTCNDPNAEMSSGECVCLLGFYRSSGRSLQCAPCHASCKSCSGGTESDCLACREHAEFGEDGLCDCKQGTFRSGFECVPCHATCRTCFGGSESECLSCWDRASLGESYKCVCGAGTFPSPDSTNCQFCDLSCLECVGNGPRQCSECPDSAYLSGAAPNSCNCNPGFYVDLSACLPCANSCATCFSLSDCQSCKANAELKDGKCVCLDGYYETASECNPCSENCSSCDEYVCLSCEFGLIVAGASCVDSCPIGYRLNSVLKVCEPGGIDAPVPSLMVTVKNDLIINFDKPMREIISREELAIRMRFDNFNEPIVTWNDPVFQDPKNVEISLIFESSWLPAGCEIELTFIHPDSIKDVFGISININSLTGTLNAFGSEPKSEHSSIMSDSAEIMAKAGVSAGITASLVNGSPSSVISLINQIQLITYLAMTKLPLTEDFAGTLAALNVEFMLPVPKLVDTEVLQPPQFAVDYGIDSTLFVSNTFVFLATSGLFAVAFILVWLLSKNRSIGSLFKRYLASYKWSIPLNLWLTSYLDLAVFALLHIRNTPIRLHSGFVVLNWVLSGAVVVCVAATPIIIIVFLYRNFKLVASQSDAAFNSRWAVFLEQFKPPYSLAGAGYYPLFVTRRVVLALTLTVTYDFLIPNMLLNTAIGIISFLFLVAYRPYKEKLDLVEAQVIEAGTVAVYIFASFFAFDLSPSTSDLFGRMGMYTVILTIAANIAFSLLHSAFTLIAIFKHYQEKMKSVKLRYQVQDTEDTSNTHS